MAEYTYKRPWVYPKQKEAIFNNARISVIEASSGSGKTLGCVIWLFEQAIQAPRPNLVYWWLAPSRHQAEIGFRTMKNAIPSHLARSNNNEKIISLNNGSTIFFKTGENPDLLYGEVVHAAVVDEASRCRPEAWHALRSTLAKTGGPVRIIGNVHGKKNWAYRMARRAEQGDNPDLAYHRLTVYDAIEGGVFSEDELELVKADMQDKNRFRELYFAEAVDDGGNPFGIDYINACTVDGLSKEYPACWGWDIGKDHSKTVGIALDSDGRVCRFHRFQDSLANTADRVINHVGDTPALIDATGKGDTFMEMLGERDAGRNFQPYVFTVKTKQQLMEGLAGAIQEGSIAFPEGTITSELESFEYTYTRNNVLYSAPEGLHDDCVDALALAVRCMKQAQRRRPRILVGAPSGLKKGPGTFSGQGASHGGLKKESPAF